MQAGKFCSRCALARGCSPVLVWEGSVGTRLLSPLAHGCCCPVQSCRLQLPDHGGSVVPCSRPALLTGSILSLVAPHSTVYKAQFSRRVDASVARTATTMLRHKKSLKVSHRPPGTWRRGLARRPLGRSPQSGAASYGKSRDRPLFLRLWPGFPGARHSIRLRPLARRSFLTRPPRATSAISRAGAHTRAPPRSAPGCQTLSVASIFGSIR